MVRRTGKAKRKFIIAAATVITLLIAGEIALRACFGFGNVLLYVTDPDYEYIAAPNQDGRIFGKRFHINSHSQRCDEPDTTKTIILGVGDSIIFGGLPTDQDSLATSVFSRETGMQMLNIGAGSWGPDNDAAYLIKHGTFGASAMVLVCSSHDAHDNIDFLPIVGHLPQYPDRQYFCAWSELFHRYLWPRFMIFLGLGYTMLPDPDEKVERMAADAENGVIVKGGDGFNPGFDALDSIARANNIPFAIVLHPERYERRLNAYSDGGREIIEWAETRGVTLYKELDYALTVDDYRDKIHHNEAGQRKLAAILKEVVNDMRITARLRE